MHSKAKSHRPSPRASAKLQVEQESGPTQQSAVLPPPDPTAVQKLIDEAIARARANRPERLTKKFDPWHLNSTALDSTNKFTVLKHLIVIFLIIFVAAYLIITGYWRYHHHTVFE